MAPSTPISDEALHKMLQQIQAQAVNAQRQLSLVRAQQAATDNARKRNHLTLREIEQERSETPLYEGVGKMFMRREHSEVVTSLRARDKQLADEVAALEKKQKFLEKQAADAQGHLRDIFSGAERARAAAADA